MELELEQMKELVGRVRQEVGKVIIGQDNAVSCALVAILTNHHALLEGVPGIAKTLLVRTLSRVLDCDFGRIQFTPDLMPSDITGTNVFDLSQRSFTLVKGPVFATFLLADEINRAPAKTQSALLQAMQERVVTIDRQSIPLPPNFTVFATQNPIEYEGTYPLPEAQKDRFMLKIKMSYPSREEETQLAQRMLGRQSPESSLSDGAVAPVLTSEQLTGFRKLLEKVTVRPEMIGYIIDIVRATRNCESLLVGAGPRATQALLLAARAWAILDQRDYVSPDDIKSLAVSVLEHRVVLRPEFEIEGHTVPDAIESVLREVTVPR